MQKKTRLVGAALMGAVLLPLAASTAFGEPASTGAQTGTARACSDELPDDPTAATSRFLTLVQTLEDQGRTQAEIDKKLAADNCVERVGGGDEANVLSNPDEEIKISKPEIYNVVGKNLYMARGSWKWIEVPNKVKGYDAFGLSFSKKVAPQAHVLSYDGEHYKKKTTSQAETSNSYGSGFIFNEGPRNPVYDDMQGRTGTIGISFKAAKKGCSNHQVFTKYGHTWNDSSVSGIAIGTTSIGFTFTDTANKWQQASHPSSEVKICRR
jgi:hypothetical protein